MVGEESPGLGQRVLLFSRLPYVQTTCSREGKHPKSGQTAGKAKKKRKPQEGQKREPGGKKKRNEREKKR